jgi:hypothetical protein
MIKGEASMTFREVIGEGTTPKRFYLPVRRSHYKRATETWFFMLAPFVLSFYLIKYSFRIIWMDIVGVVEDLECYYRKKKNKV